MKTKTTEKYLKVLCTLETKVKTGLNTKVSLQRTVDLICKGLGYEKSIGHQFIQVMLRSRWILEDKKAKAWRWNLVESANYDLVNSAIQGMNGYNQLVQTQKLQRDVAKRSTKKILKASTKSK